MRAGLSTIQQTLTPEAASVLNHSIAEAARRNHGQTTPLHVAATLLASPSGYLRQACIRSHPNSSHPLQCRALELCFSVALERLPSAQNLSPGLEPPISNALMAALKRAQAHQRRGCPEQQQQPLLAVKVELEQLIVSILDDPSVSRVMREASFSSPAVKATIEQSLNSAGTASSGAIGGGLGFRPAPLVNRNLYLNPRLQQGSLEPTGQQRKEEVKRVIDIMLRSKKRNPVLVGESEPEAVMRELLQKIEKREIGEGLLQNVQVVSLEKEFGSDRSQIPAKLIELGNSFETRINSGGGVILDLGDLKWLVEQPAGFGVTGTGPLQQIVSEAGRTAVAEMGKLLTRFGEGGGSGGRLWLIGTATCETYLRCQVYHPSMENDWDLQAVPIAARSPVPALFSRLGSNGILSSSVGSLTPLKGFPMVGAPLPSRRPSENSDPSRGSSCCPACMGNYEQELAKLSMEFEKSSSDAKTEARPTLPQWMQIVKQNNADSKLADQPQTKDQELAWKQKTEELQKKWNETCRHLHPSFHSVAGSLRPATMAQPVPSLYNPNLTGRQPFQPKLQLTRTLPTLQMGHIPQSNPTNHPVTPPGSPVRTDLALGRQKIPENSVEKTHKERIKDFAGCIPSEWQDGLSNQQGEKQANALDADSFKRIFKGLTEKVGWQPEAASEVAMTIIRCKSGNGKRRGPGAKGDTWLLFLGPDKVGKKKMALALSELVCGTNPITIHLGSRSGDDEESGVNFRGKTVLDRIVEAVRRNPFSVVVLEDMDRADMLVHSSIKRAVEKGRLTDSHGREVGLGSVIFILTADWWPENLKGPPNSTPHSEEKLMAVASHGWQLQIMVSGKTGKRRAEWGWDADDDRPTKPRKEPSSPGPGLSIDLNLAADVTTDEDGAEGSRNSSDLTVEHGHDRGSGPANRWMLPPLSMPPTEIIELVDERIVFKPVDFGPLRAKVATTIANRFSSIVGDGRSIQVGDEVLDRIVGGAWFGGAGLDEWVDRVLVPGFQQLKGRVPLGDDCTVVKLVPVKGGHVPVPEARKDGDWLPSKINVVVEGL
ncbi:protein SUPPRESSOR OF MAX2 1-like [Magnolia sinica]|uniref:protein SUPPRESSOR OF MAX2 1-like n=1 Tax=Magnolia sinica TaxID=86752 RepID=UPI002659B8DB|nr:protein SUPPRESSOR OF MAX2 1-like [Magnolia sinica]